MSRESAFGVSAMLDQSHDTLRERTKMDDLHIARNQLLAACRYPVRRAVGEAVSQIARQDTRP